MTPPIAPAGALPPRLFTLDDVLITHLLNSRRTRVPDHAAENEALIALAATLSESPQAVFQTLVQKVLELTHADSTGISVAENNGDESIFRWYATAGNFSRYIGGTMPRNLSPCGTVLEQRVPLLMRAPEHYYPFGQELCNPIEEVLLVPFFRGDVPIGTVWVIAHTKDKHFDKEDRRLIENLCRFATHAVKNMQDLKSLAEAKQSLAVESRLKTEFLVTMSHELRSPLSAITMAAEILRVTIAEPAPARNAVGIVERQAGLLKRLTDDLLDVSRTVTGKMQLQKTRSRLVDIVDMAVETNQSYMDVRGHRFKLDLEQLPAETYIEADAPRIAQALANILANATRYTPHGGDITLRVSLDAGDVIISIRDTGPGIAPPMLSKVFDMFSQAEETRRGGLGIGLALVKSIVELHGGTVTAISDGVAGSEFIIRLPLM
ncbi:MAG: GAF domain-containing sensor histidine kinase [Burkholderiales bacterium]